jgi:hypothetical protein
VNNRQLYLAWLRTAAPDVYMTSLRKALRQSRTLGGLDSDLVDSMTAPSTFGAFGQDSSSDGSLPEVTITADTWTPPDLTSFPDYYTLPLAPSDLTPVTPVDTGITMPTVEITPATGYVPPDTGAPAAGGNWWDTIIKTVGTVVTAGITTSSQQSNLIKLNTQRAAQGLPPVDQYGRVITPAGTNPATSAIYRLESLIAGTGGGLSPVILLAGVGLLAFVLFKRK